MLTSKQTDRQTDTQTDAGENIIAKEVERTYNIRLEGSKSFPIVVGDFCRSGVLSGSHGMQ